MGESLGEAGALVPGGQVVLDLKVSRCVSALVVPRCVSALVVPRCVLALVGGAD